MCAGAAAGGGRGGNGSRHHGLAAAGLRAEVLSHQQYSKAENETNRVLMTVCFQPRPQKND